MKVYYEGRPGKELYEGYGPYRMKVRYFADSNQAQVTVYNVADKLPLIWSKSMTDTEANAALDLFKAVGFFDLV